MKRKITLCSLAVILLSTAALKAQQNFTGGNLVVLRVGEGGATPLGTYAGAVHLDEYETSGGYVQTIDLPTETSSPNYRIVVGRATGSSQGYHTLSPDGKYLAIAGYDAAEGTENTTLQNAATGRVFAIVSNGVTEPIINTTTRVVIGNSDNRAAVTSDGTSIWFGGTSQGVQYTTLGSTTSVQVTATPGPTRGGLAIFNGQLYQSTNQDPYRIAKIGNGLPTIATTATAVTGLEATGSNLPADHTANGFVFFDVDSNVPGNDLLYFVTELGGGFLQKFVRTDPNNDVWVNKGAVSGGLLVNMRALTGTLINGVPTLYAAAYTNVIKIVDNAAYTVDLDASVTNVVTAGANMAFRGISFAPSSNVITTLPVTLTSFRGKAEQNFVKLNWTTASEQNNSHFEVLRSADGKAFNVIGRVGGNNNSNVAINYEYKDQNPLNTTVYYRLNQLDHDGKSELSNIIVVKSGLNVSKDFKVYTSGESVVVKFNSPLQAKGKIAIYNTAGKTIATQEVAITTGENVFTVPAKGIENGSIYIALLDVAGNIQSVKFMANSR